MSHYVPWEYLFVQIALSRGFQASVYRPFAVNGKRLERWDKGPDWQEYFVEKGKEGWEFVAFDDTFLTDTVVGGKMAIFKRKPVRQPSQSARRQTDRLPQDYSPPFLQE